MGRGASSAGQRGGTYEYALTAAVSAARVSCPTLADPHPAAGAAASGGRGACGDPRVAATAASGETVDLGRDGRLHHRGHVTCALMHSTQHAEHTAAQRRRTAVKLWQTGCFATGIRLLWRGKGLFGT